MGKINREILRLSVPAIVSNITVPLLGLCDTAISGHLGSEIFLASIAVGSVMLNTIYWLFGFLRMGTTGLTANAYGHRDDEAIARVFTRAVLLAILAGVIIILAREPLADVLVALINPEKEVTEYVREYFSLCIFGAPAALGIMAVSGWFVGMQTTVYPMWIAIIVNVINIAMSFTFVFILEYGFKGVAAGTLAANWSGFILAIACALWLRRGGKLWCSIRKALAGGGISKFFTVNANLFFRSACIIAVSLGVTAAGARMGALTLAVNVIVMQLFQFFSFFMDGFAFGAEALVGKCSGSGQSGEMQKTVGAFLKWTLGMSAFFTIAYGTGCDVIAGVLTDQNHVVAGISSLRVLIALIPLLSAWAFIYDGFYVGITKTGKMMVATMISTIVFYVVAFLHYEDGRISIQVNSNVMLWIAFLSYLTLRGMLLALQWRKSIES